MVAEERWRAIRFFAEGQSPEDSLPESPTPTPHFLYLRLRTAVASRQAGAVRELLERMADLAEETSASRLSSSDLFLDALEVARPLLPAAELESRLGRRMEALVKREDWQEAQGQLQRLVRGCDAATRRRACAQILGRRFDASSLRAELVEAFLRFLVENGHHRPASPAVFARARQLLSHPAIRHLALELHLAAPDAFALSETEWTDLHRWGRLDAETARWIGLCHAAKRRREQALAVLRRCLCAVRRNVEAVTSIFRVAVEEDDRPLALRCLAQLARGPIDDLAPLREIAPWASRIDLSPHWQELLEAADASPALAEARPEIRTLLCEELFRLDRGTEALEIYLGLGDRRFAATRLRIRVIEELVARGLGEEARAEFDQLPEKTREHHIHYTVLRIRAATAAGRPEERRRLLAAAPDDFRRDESFLTELALCRLDDQEWRALRRLLDQGPYAEPALQALRLVAAARHREYALVREEFDPRLLQPPAPRDRETWSRLRGPLAEAVLYSFAMDGDWPRVRDLLAGLTFPDPDDPVPVFFQYLATIYQRLAEAGEGEEAADLYHQACGWFEQLLVLARGPRELELLATLFEQSRLGRPDAARRVQRSRELGTYLLYLVLLQVEERLPALEASHPADFRDLSGALATADLRTALGLLRRAETLTDSSTGAPP